MSVPESASEHRRGLRFSLRGRLTAVVAILTIVGLAAAGIATYVALQRFLIDRTDETLRASWQPIAEELARQANSRYRPPGGGGNATVGAPSGTYGEMRTAAGDVVASLVVTTLGQESSGTKPDLPADPDGGGRGHFFTVGSKGDGPRYRVLAVNAGTTDGGTVTVLTAVPIDGVDSTLRRLVVIELVVFGLVLLAAIVIGRWAVGLGLRPLNSIETTAEAIAAGDLSRRVPDDDPRTEVGRLGGSLNTMLGQIEGAVSERDESEQRLRRFVLDASHELRTPLTSIRGYAELFRRGAASNPDDLATAMRRIEEEAVRMGLLVDDLLVLARLDEGRPLELTRVDVTRLASDAVTDARAAEPDRPVDLVVDGSAIVVGDEARIRQVAANLLANARQHTTVSTPVHVRVSTSGDDVLLAVADEGPGMDPATASRAFERFFRSDGVRPTDGGGGAGLGLSIVAAIAEAHGGSAGVQTKPGEGATFTVRFPVTGPPTDAGETAAWSPPLGGDRESQSPPLGGDRDSSSHS